MIDGQNEIRNRVEELKLSYTGYRRQLGASYLTAERRERLDREVAELEEEISALDRLAQMGRLEADRAKIEQAARERLADIRAELANDPALADYPEEQRDMASGEARALIWALGEDKLTELVREVVGSRDKTGAATAANLPVMLMRNLSDGPDVDTRAGAAYELGRLGIVEAIPRLATALSDEKLVADLAFDALCRYSSDQLEEAGVPDALRDQIEAARRDKGKA